MESKDELGGWGAVVSLALFCLVWASMQWNVLTGLLGRGPTVFDSVQDVALFAMLLITLAATVYAIRETVTE